ncbi:Gfo/Idh/MocA family protein [Streptomyces diastaticus]|uniref:Gfo/Idh/MocA family protein n=1 Tax=unclassified Streptomyces TaxID=2593676 RepID=UPI0013B7C563|nr:MULTISPECIES: Gfo/Idh/MocA family oxidoreductase [unclassified Streptomyces]NEE40158.1 Gfo/Idh/MocA family oxidoreductase [Streptomyces sp. SID7982]MBL3807840.1 Gfo/Idh/MocA family oxidoreductase [Streptomyces sp. BRB081]MDQ0296976.1 virulence factor [Streptomyces sp. DSM 41037]NEC11301.1 Gfo/Idh/MocA family oxidoreductase [Streptomyces sp. SID8014]WPR50196.1 Gfo/Idh/MocA family oxidoreductase [Streptomyces sp. S399]
MRVGCIGLGDIAQKAYLPVLTARPGVELHLQTRTPATLARTAAAYHLPEERCHRDLDSLLAARPDAAFVHAPTEAHESLVSRLIEAGVPTYVDKPLAYDYAACERLVDRAGRRGVPLAVGFNRRFAPAYVRCLEHPRDLILLQKNRVGLPERPRGFVFDDFIHVIDTLRFLVPGPVDHVGVRVRVDGGLLHHAVLQLGGEGFTALGVMNRLSGSTEEVLEVSGRDAKRQVLNISDVVDHDGRPTLSRRGDWVPVPRQRGIEQAALAFLDSVRAGETLDAQDALETHELCERVVREAEAAAGAG